MFCDEIHLAQFPVTGRDFWQHQHWGPGEAEDSCQPVRGIHQGELLGKNAGKMQLLVTGTKADDLEVIVDGCVGCQALANYILNKISWHVTL
jgi:hypothetical protein